MIFILALLACSAFSSETTEEVVPVSTAVSEIIAQTETTAAPTPLTCIDVFLNTACSSNSPGSTCEVECLSGEPPETFTYVCDDTTLEWVPQTVGEECVVDVLQWHMHDLYCEHNLIELEPQMSAYQCADVVASNPDCPTDMFVFVPFETCKCVKSVSGCELEYIEATTTTTADGIQITTVQTTREPTYITVNATTMYAPLVTDKTCGEKQFAIQYCKKCEWEEIISIEECAGEVLENDLCSPIFSWRDDRDEEKNQCWCVPVEYDGCEFEDEPDYITYSLIEHRDLTGNPPTSELKNFTLTMIVVTMVVTPIALLIGWVLHWRSYKSRKGDDFNDILLDTK